VLVQHRHLGEHPARHGARLMGKAGEEGEQVAPAHVDAELISGLFLQMVGLVDDEVLVLGEHARFQCQV